MVAPLGAGGMGEVYRARDTKLNREVALKILPEVFSSDPERLARFQREAQILASLNHPNIAAIYGLEEADGVKALVLELVEGPTLAECIAAGALSPGTGERVGGRRRGLALDEAMPIARQIADALEAAHVAEVIHRDLKPANIKVRPDGTVKVLDFGLAKLIEPIGTPSVAQGFSPGEEALSQSPTLTTPPATRMGVVMGTAAYMSPEQAKGKPVDKRADIWAFGCVLYEMLSGRRAFDGDDVTDTLAAVVRGEPNWSALPADTPAAIRRLLRRCLEKDRKERIPDIGVARIEIRDALTAPASEATPATHASRPGREGLAWVLAAVSFIALIGLGAATYLRQAPLDVYRMSILPPAPLDQDFAENFVSGEHLRRIARLGRSETPRRQWLERGVCPRLPALAARRNAEGAAFRRETAGTDRGGRAVGGRRRAWRRRRRRVFDLRDGRARFSTRKCVRGSAHARLGGPRRSRGTSRTPARRVCAAATLA
jgi:hypothetical protein